MNKKGISLVALVITIIVLIILTGAVILTGVNAPTNASTAVEDWNRTQVQDAVTVFIMNHIANGAGGATLPTVENAIDQFATINGDTVTWDANAETVLGLNGIELTGNYTIDKNGTVSSVE